MVIFCLYYTYDESDTRKSINESTLTSFPEDSNEWELDLCYDDKYVYQYFPKSGFKTRTESFFNVVGRMHEGNLEMHCDGCGEHFHQRTSALESYGDLDFDYFHCDDCLGRGEEGGDEDEDEDEE